MGAYAATCQVACAQKDGVHGVADARERHCELLFAESERLEGGAQLGVVGGQLWFRLPNGGRLWRARARAHEAR